MTVFYGKIINTKEDIAIKIENKKEKKSSVNNEAIILSLLNEIQNVPKILVNENMIWEKNNC